MFSRPVQKAMATNVSSSAFTAKTTLRTSKPSGNSVLPLTDGRTGRIPRRARFYPYGVGSANDVFSLRIWGWYLITPSNDLYMPAQLGEFSCTLGSFAGVAGGAIVATELFCDTISIVATVGEATITADTTRQGTVELYSPANNMPAWFEMDLRGAQLLEFDFDQTTNTPTGNALIQFID